MLCTGGSPFFAQFSFTHAAPPLSRELNAHADCPSRVRSSIERNKTTKQVHRQRLRLGLGFPLCLRPWEHSGAQSGPIFRRRPGNDEERFPGLRHLGPPGTRSAVDLAVTSRRIGLVTSGPSPWEPRNFQGAFSGQDQQLLWDLSPSLRNYENWIYEN